MSFVPLQELAQGRWRSILPTFGVDARALSGKHGPCPMCGGKDRFRFDDKGGRGTWICNRCGAGDGVALAARVGGLSFRDLAIQVREMLGVSQQLRPRPPVPTLDSEKRAAMNSAWISGATVKPGDPVAMFLDARVGLTTFPKCLRAAPRVRYQADPVSHHPAMLAKVMDEDGQPVNLHRTYLTTDGHKAPVDEPRRLMQGALPHGSAIRLFPAGPVMGIAEGIETAFAAASLFDLPVWAAINAGNLATWTPPAGTVEVVVFGDNDVSFTGHAAAFALARRLMSKGILARVEIPPQCGTDWNDVWLEQQGHLRLKSKVVPAFTPIAAIKPVRVVPSLKLVISA